MIDVSFHRSQSNCDVANSLSLVELNIDANFEISVFSLHTFHARF